MRLLLIGAPGAGKGTQAELLAERFGIAHISSGDLLRQHVADQTALGRTAKAYLDRGDLVPDAVVMDMMRKPVVAAAQAGGYVLDGFPRTVEQAKTAFATAQVLGVEVQAAVHIDVPRAELVRRLLARRRGSDDTEAIIERRLQVYLDKTVPLLEYYADREWMFAVNGAQPPAAVHEDIVARLKKLADAGIFGPLGVDLDGDAGPRGSTARCGEGRRHGGLDDELRIAAVRVGAAAGQRGEGARRLPPACPDKGQKVGGRWPPYWPMRPSIRSRSRSA